MAYIDMGSYIEDPVALTYNSSKQGWLVSILELGAWLGTMYSGFLAEILSRKYAILINVAVFVVGVVVQTTSVSGGHASILAGRFITGKLNSSRYWSTGTDQYRYGCRFTVYDRSHVQRRNRSSRSSWCTCWSSAAVHHAWYHDQFLD